MAVIDFHIHIGRQEDWHDWVNEYLKKVNPDLYSRFDEIMNPDGFQAYLQNHGIDYAVILAEESPITTGIVSNEYVAEFCQNIVVTGPPVNIDNNTPKHPYEFQLSQNFPNPFNPTTKIVFSIPQKIHVRLSVWNTLGEKIATLVDETRPAGNHTVTFNASDIASGLYFYRLEAGSYIIIKKMLLMRWYHIYIKDINRFQTFH